jgi:hypothetical protein
LETNFALLKVVGIDAFGDGLSKDRNPRVEVDHGVCKTLPVNEHHRGGNAGRAVNHLCCAEHGGYENTLLRALTPQRADGLSNFRATNRTLPSLRLNVHSVQPETVFLDDSVSSTVATFPDPLAGVAARAAIAQPDAISCANRAAAGVVAEPGGR